MFLIEAIPLTKIPFTKTQILSYFYGAFLSKGALISVPLGHRKEKAIVWESHQMKGHEMEIKDAEYELRPIKKILTAAPILTASQIKLALWLSQYYFTSPGLFAKIMLPKNAKKFILSGALSRRPAGKREVEGQKLILAPTLTQINSAAKNCRSAKTVIIHSGLKAKQLNENWQKIASGEAKIIIGTRLAVFAPFVNLKEIMIRDETNAGHRSFDMFPHYRTHEVAKKLAELFGAKLTFESNLPSVESSYFSQISPIGPINHTKTELIDLRQEIKEGNYSIFSRRLQKAINEALKNKQQIILFINRRGAATFVLCRDCGYVVKCSSCDAPMTYHLTRGRISDDRQISDRSRVRAEEKQLEPILFCHHCGQRQNPPTLCPKCQSYRIKAFGTGTQRVEAEAQKLFKEAKILRLDSDLAKAPAEQEKIINEFKQKRADILIGTQMILSADLLKAALVAVISADTLLHLPDFRSDEKTFQIIHQLKNLAKDNFIVQTYNPQTKIIGLAVQGDFKTFYEQEIETRQALNYPPFSQIIKLVFRHKNPKKAATEAKILATKLSLAIAPLSGAAKLTQQIKTSKPPHLADFENDEMSKQKEAHDLSSAKLYNSRCGGKILRDTIFEISEAVPAFISKEKGKYVWQIILKAKSYWLAPKKERENLLNLRNKILMMAPYGWEIDVDPETLL